jgi:nucleotide-binding universal stress UspA family protein
VAIAPRAQRDRPVDAVVERIGVGYVDAPESREALRVAGELAERTGASLRLYTVVAPRAEIFSPVVGRDAEEAFLRSLREQAQAALDDAVAAVPEGVPAAAELLEGDVVDELASLDERDVDLLVCGSRGYGPVRRVLLGGVARRLSKRAASPLVIVPRSATVH